MPNPTIDDALSQLDDFMGTMESAVENSQKSVEHTKQFIGDIEQSRQANVEHIRTVAQQQIDDVNEQCDKLRGAGEQRIEKARARQKELLKAVIVRPIRLVGRMIRTILGF